MKKNQVSKALLHRISQYSAVALALAPNTIEAKVVNTDIDPDTTITGNGNIYALDLNNDFITDFRFEMNQVVQSTYTTQSIVIKPQSNNQVGAFVSNFTTPWSSGTGSAITPYKLAYNVIVDSIVPLVTSPAVLALFQYGTSFGSFRVGKFANAKDVYIGLQFIKSNDTLFGYVRVSVSALADSLTIKDYGYNDDNLTGIFTGQKAIKVAPAPTSIIVSDVQDNNDGRDLNVFFNASTNEEFVGKYRVFVVPSTVAGNFNLAMAQSILPGRFTDILPTLAPNYSSELDSTAVDINGSIIRNNLEYKIFVMSVADGVKATVNELSFPSAAITLRSEAEAVAWVNVEDIDNKGNGADLKVSFPKAANEWKVGTYRIIVVKSDSASSYSLLDANLEFNFTPLVPTGLDIVQILPLNATDSDGHQVKENVPYKVFVLSVADGANADFNNLSIPSVEINLDPLFGWVKTEAQSQLSKLSALQNKLLIKPVTALGAYQVNVYDLSGKMISSVDGLQGDYELALTGNKIYIAELISLETKLIQRQKIWIP